MKILSAAELIASFILWNITKVELTDNATLIMW